MEMDRLFRKWFLLGRFLSANCKLVAYLFEKTTLFSPVYAGILGEICRKNFQICGQFSNSWFSKGLIKKWHSWGRIGYLLLFYEVQLYDGTATAWGVVLLRTFSGTASSKALHQCNECQYSTSGDHADIAACSALSFAWEHSYIVILLYDATPPAAPPEIYETR